MKRLTAMLLTLALLLSLLAIPAAQADSYATATVKGGWLRLRAGATTNSETISAYYTGTRVTILGGAGDWYYVSTPDGKTGYMNANYLTITGSITGGQLDENTAAYVTSKNGLSVRLRTGPSKQYATIASYAVGTPVTILISGDEWCKVRIGGRTGYMMTEFLTTTSTGGSAGGESSAYTAYVTSSNGLGVRVRSGASKLYPTLATYSVGTQVTVLEYGKTWCKIRVNNLTGYMMTEFLTTTAPSTKTVKYVTLSQTTAEPGDVLGASITPSTATVKWEWLNSSGHIVGTSRFYTVKQSDAGDKLRVRVTGTGDTSGSAVSGWVTITGDSYTSVGYVLTGISISDSTPTVGQTLTATIRPTGATANISWFRDDGVFVASGSTYTVRSTDVGRRLYAWADGTGVTSGEVTSNYTQSVAAANSGSSDGTGSVSGTRIMSVTLSDTTPTVGQTLYATVNPTSATATVTWYRDDDKILGVGPAYTVRADDAGHTMYVWAEGSGTTFGSATSSITAPVSSGAATFTDIGW